MQGRQGKSTFSVYQLMDDGRYLVEVTGMGESEAGFLNAHVSLYGSKKTSFSHIFSTFV